LPRKRLNPAVPLGVPSADLDRIFAIRHDDRVGNDNPLRVNNLTLQIEKSRFRDHFVKCRVEVFEHLDGGLEETHHWPV
jgi:hypothetical protein